MYFVGSPQEAARLAPRLGKRIFVATGSTTAKAFRSAGKKQGCKTYVRVLPEDNSLRKCRVAGFTEDEIITGVGPFSYQDNFEIWQRLAIDVVITKDSGLPGGFAAKARAARELGINLIVIRRPAASQSALKSVDEVIKALSELNAV
jgi:precorrin-6x reductase